MLHCRPHYSLNDMITDTKTSNSN